MSRLQEYYKSTVQPKLAKDLGLKNPMQVPKITKITVNMGVGDPLSSLVFGDVLLNETTAQSPPEHLSLALAGSRLADRLFANGFDPPTSCSSTTSRFSAVRRERWKNSFKPSTRWTVGGERLSSPRPFTRANSTACPRRLPRN